MLEQTTYRLALIIPESRLLLAVNDAGIYRLPTIDIPMWERQAEQLSSQIEARWNIKTLVLDLLSDPNSQTASAVLEIRGHLGQYSDGGFSIVTLDKIDRTALNTNERATIQSILDGGDAGHGPFSRLGWIEEAKAWIKRSIGDEGLRFTEDMRHLNGGASSV